MWSRKADVIGSWVLHYRATTSRDPIAENGGINLYTYVNGNPSNLTDQSGRCPWCVGALIGAGLDIGLQLLTNGGNVNCINWWEVGASAAVGAFGGWLGELGAAEGAIANAGKTTVYQSINAAGEVQYVGITDNLAARAAAHLSEKGISIQPIPGLSNIARADARTIEQVLIENYGLGKNGGTLLNKINSIASSNPIYNGAIQRGADILKSIGYPGF